MTGSIRGTPSPSIPTTTRPTWAFVRLRVMNEDRVQPGQGFGMHGHRDMEIVTYVLEGALEHRDSMGNGSIIHAGEFQRMSAGTGIQHGEFNPSTTEPVHLYQIWLLPSHKGPDAQLRATDVLRGREARQAAPGGLARGGWIADDPPGRPDLPFVAAKRRATGPHDLQPGRHAWLQVLRGSVEINGQQLATSDGAAVSDETNLTIRAAEPSEVMLFELS